MSTLVKVYNKGTRPIVWLRSRRNVKAIHPGKFDVFGKVLADEIIRDFPDAVSESDYNKPEEKKTYKKKDEKKMYKELEEK